MDISTVYLAVDNGRIPSQDFFSPPPYIDSSTYVLLCQHLDEIVKSPVATAYGFAHWQSSKNAHGTLGLAIRNAKHFLQATELMKRFGKLRSDVFSISTTQDEKYLYFTTTIENPDLFPCDSPITQFVISSYLFNAEIFLRQTISNSSKQYDAKIYMQGQMHESDVPRVGNLVTIFDNSQLNTLCVPISAAQVPFQSANEKLCQRFLSLLEKEISSLPNQGLLNDVRSAIKKAEWQDVTIGNIANQLNLSVSTLQRRLKEENTTFSILKNNERVQSAKELLLLTSASLATIADQLGFSNTSNFTKSFKTIEGCSPNEYRKLKASMNKKSDFRRSNLGFSFNQTT